MEEAKKVIFSEIIKTILSQPVSFTVRYLIFWLLKLPHSTTCLSTGSEVHSISKSESSGFNVIIKNCLIGN